MFTSSSPLSQSYSSIKNLRVSRFSSVETSAETPYQTHVKSIGKRFDNLKEHIQAKHVAAKSEETEKKIRQIDQNIADNHKAVEDSLNRFTRDINELEEKVATEVMARELLAEQTIKEMQLIEINLADELKKESQLDKEAERVILGKCEGKIYGLRAQFAEEQARQEIVKRENNEMICAQFEELECGIREERIIREEFQNALISSMTAKVNKVHESLQIERKLMQETERFLFSKFEEITKSLERQLNVEIERRDIEEAQMLTLLEGACERLERHIGY